MLKRALGYLYTKETKSSFAIEQINPTSTRTERFVALLQLAEQEDFCRKAQLVEVQTALSMHGFARPTTERPRTSSGRRSLGKKNTSTL